MQTKCLLAAAAVAAALLFPNIDRVHAAEPEEGFQSLFDGESLSGWEGDPKLWSVEEGAIVGVSTKDNPLTYNQFLIWKGGDVDDFVLRLEFRIADTGAGNSGIQYRSKRLPDVGEWAVGGYQADIERTNRYMGIFYEERGRGILAERGQKVVLKPATRGVEIDVVGSVGDPAEIVEGVKAGEWQDFEVIAQGNQFTHKINGKTTVSVVDEDAEHAAKRGVLALQLHAGEPMKIEFRNIRLRSQTDKPTDAADN